MSVFSLSNLKKTWYYLQKNGIRNAVWAVLERIGQEQEVYTWQEPDEKTLSFQREHSASLRISIVVPAYRTKKEHLEAMLNSVSRQSYPHWELIVADAGGTAESVQAWAKKNGICLREAADASNLAEWKDQSIVLCTLSENKGISANTNAGIELAAGDAVGLLDHDDLLTANALWEMAGCLEKEKKRGKQKLVLFSDEDKCDGAASRFYEPNFKPDFDGELLLTNNYICHFTVIETAFLKELKLRSGFDGAQDYDLMLRAYAAGGQFVHVPKVLYHWRVHKASTADNPLSKKYAYDAGKRAVTEHIRRCGEEAEVTDTLFPGFYRAKYQVTGEPLVSIIIPNKDEKETLKKCLDSIKEKSTYRNYEIIIVENNSTGQEIFDYYKEIDGRDGIRVVYWKSGFNYSALNNFGFTFAKGDYILCLNNDVTVITPDWLERMIGQCQRKEVGIVGVKLYYPDDTIQHAGVIIGIGGVAGAMFVGMARERSGYLRKAILQQDLSAVTAACMMVDRKAWEGAGGFNEDLAVAFNDIDFCLKVRREGYLVVYEPNVELYHYESKSRGYEDTPEKQKRFLSEINYMKAHWSEILTKGDPYYNENFSLNTCNYTLRKR